MSCAQKREGLEVLEQHGKALVAFCARVRARGGRATVEEDLDLPALRRRWRQLRRVDLAVARLDELGPTPVDQARVEQLRQAIARRSPSGKSS